MARQNSRGDSAARKIVVRASAVENWSTALRDPSSVRARWVFLRLFYTKKSTERGANAVENSSATLRATETGSVIVVIDCGCGCGCGCGCCL